MATDEELRKYFCGYVENKSHYKKMLTDRYYRVHYTGNEADFIISMAEAVAIQFILDHAEDNPPRLTKAPGPLGSCTQEPEIYYPDDPRYYIFTEVLYIRTKSGKRKPEEWANFEAFDGAGQSRWNGAPSQITNYFWSCVGRPIRLVDIEGEGDKGPKYDDESVWEEKFGGGEEEVIEEIVERVVELHPPDMVAVGEILEFINQQDWVTSIGLTGDPNNPSIQFGPHAELEKILPFPIQEILPSDFYALVIDPSARPISLMSEEELAGLYDTATEIFIGLQKRTNIWDWIFWLISQFGKTPYPDPSLKSNIKVANELGMLIEKVIMPEFDKAISRIDAIRALPEEQRRLLLGKWVRVEGKDRYDLPEVRPITKGFFWYLWKDLQFAAKSWGYYYDQANLEIIEKIYPGITGTLRDKITERLKEEYWNAIPSSSLEGLYLVNRIIQSVPGRFNRVLPSDMESPSDYDFTRDVLRPTIGEYFLSEYYRRVVPLYKKRPYIGHISPSIQSMETAVTQGSPMHPQFVGLGGGGTGYTLPTTTPPTGGDGVLASPAGQASSLPSFPPVGLPGLGAGPSALPSPVGFGGAGWGGAAMPAPSVVPAGWDGAMASGGYFLGGLKQLVAGQVKPGGGFSPALDLGAFLLAPFKNLLQSQRPSAPGSRGGRFTERLFQIPQMLLTGVSPVGPFLAAEQLGGGLFARLLSPPQPPISAPQIVHRFEKGSVEIHTQKIDAKTLGNAFMSFLAEQSRQ